ncbi:uncharacterized protein LOC108676771, partial [Hyalella azteca]|uniref:Uncharacterized protein LOC108676771 n=1 Tax=Hyalella azteca TaxID=294128 RepID=A0A8B7P2Z6_HYAAZ
MSKVLLLTLLLWTIATAIGDDSDYSQYPDYGPTRSVPTPASPDDFFNPFDADESHAPDDVRDDSEVVSNEGVQETRNVNVQELGKDIERYSGTDDGDDGVNLQEPGARHVPLMATSASLQKQPDDGGSGDSLLSLPGQGKISARKIERTSGNKVLSPGNDETAENHEMSSDVAPREKKELNSVLEAQQQASNSVNDSDAATGRNPDLEYRGDQNINNSNDDSNADFETFDVVDAKRKDTVFMNVNETVGPTGKLNPKPVIRTPIPVFTLPDHTDNNLSSFMPPGGVFNISLPAVDGKGSEVKFVPDSDTTRALPATALDPLFLGSDVVAKTRSASLTGPLSSLSPRPVSSLGEVSSPFFFLCHFPQQGELPSSYSRPSPDHHRLDQPDTVVNVRLSVLGNRKLDRGYQPSTRYEMGVMSSVGVDGFLVTGVQAVPQQQSLTLAAPL